MEKFDVEKFFERANKEEFDDIDMLAASLKCTREVAAYIRHLEKQIERMEYRLCKLWDDYRQRLGW